VFETLAIWRPAIWNCLTDARKAHAGLCPPFIKASTAIRRGKLYTTFSPDHLYIVGTCAIAVDELFLFLVPDQFGLGASLCDYSLISAEIKSGMPCLLGKCFSIS
jgi:hypothetical protein